MEYLFHMEYVPHKLYKNNKKRREYGSGVNFTKKKKLLQIKSCIFLSWLI